MLNDPVLPLVSTAESDRDALWADMTHRLTALQNLPIKLQLSTSTQCPPPLLLSICLTTSGVTQGQEGPEMKKKTFGIVAQRLYALTVTQTLRQKTEV